MRVGAILALVCALPIALAAPSASADWQYTKWGMTADQVKTAAGAKIVPLPSGRDLNYKNGKAQLAATYATGPYQFLVVFVFSTDSNGLNHVHLELSNIDKCEPLHGDLESKYGAPKDDSMPDLGLYVFSWRDAANKNFVTFVGNRKKGGDYDSCSVQYQPMGGEGGSGL